MSELIDAKLSMIEILESYMEFVQLMDLALTSIGGATSEAGRKIMIETTQKAIISAKNHWSPILQEITTSIPAEGPLQEE